VDGRKFNQRFPLKVLRKSLLGVQLVELRVIGLWQNQFCLDSKKEGGRGERKEKLTGVKGFLSRKWIFSGPSKEKR